MQPVLARASSPGSCSSPGVGSTDSGSEGWLAHPTGHPRGGAGILGKRCRRPSLPGVRRKRPAGVEAPTSHCLCGSAKSPRIPELTVLLSTRLLFLLVSPHCPIWVFFLPVLITLCCHLVWSLQETAAPRGQAARVLCRCAADLCRPGNEGESTPHTVCRPAPPNTGQTKEQVPIRKVPVRAPKDRSKEVPGEGTGNCGAYSVGYHAAMRRHRLQPPVSTGSALLPTTGEGSQTELALGKPSG